MKSNSNLANLLSIYHLWSIFIFVIKLSQQQSCVCDCSNWSLWPLRNQVVIVQMVLMTIYTLNLFECVIKVITIAGWSVFFLRLMSASSFFLPSCWWRCLLPLWVISTCFYCRRVVTMTSSCCHRIDDNDFLLSSCQGWRRVFTVLWATYS